MRLPVSHDAPNGEPVGAGTVGGPHVSAVSVSEVRAHHDGTERPVVLRAEGVTKSYRRGVWPRRRVLTVLRGAQIELCAGEVVGLVGENGSGKSTFMKILVGALDADAGTVSVSGRVGYCPQEPLLYERLTCDEHLELFGVAYGMDAASIAAASESLYASLGFARWRSAQVDELSGGTHAKLNLALALLADPEVLLLPM